MKTALAIIVLLACSAFVSAQKIAKPTLEARPCSETQLATVHEGVKLHDAKNYSGAVEKYQQVLAENPDCTLVIYELAMTYYAMGERTKAMETAHRGSKYKSDELPLFYMTMANAVDDVGKPEEAIKIYRDAIKMLDGDKDMARHLSTVYYNLAVTLTKQQKYPEARAALKKAVEYNYQYPSPHFLLASIYRAGRYKIPAFLAACRYLSLEPTSPRAPTSARVIRETLAPAPKNDKTGNIEIFVDMNAPKDEGDFAMFELFLGTVTTIGDKEDEKKSEEQKFAEAVGRLIGLVAENKNVKSTFVGKYYVPFAAEMKQRGYAEVLGYIVLHHTGNESARKWLAENEAKMKEFFVWSKTYSLTQ